MDESFTDKIEGYGVRAYKIKLADNPAPVQVALDMTALEDEKAPSVDVPGIMRQVMLGKNHVPNPCFKQQFNKGIPDFYKPYPFSLGMHDPDAGKKGSTWYVDHEMLWNGIHRCECSHRHRQKTMARPHAIRPPRTSRSRWFSPSTPKARKTADAAADCLSLGR